MKTLQNTFKKTLRAGMISASMLAAAANGAIKINEIRIDQPSIDTQEYIEIYSDAGSEPLTGMTLVVIGDSSVGSGAVEKVFDLGALTASPFLLIAPDTFGLPGAGTPDATLPGNFFENSDNITVLIVTGFTASVGDDLDADDDGALDSEPWTEVIDAVGIIEEAPNPPTFTESEYASSLGFMTVGPGDGTDFGGNPTTPGHVYRVADGSGLWTFGPFDPFDFESEDSPGATNAVNEEISLSLGANTMSESGGSTTLTVALDSPASADVPIIVSLANFDGSEVDVPTIVVPSGSSSETVTITAIDDTWRDFDQTVTIRTKAFGYFPATIAVTVEDDETGDPTGLRVNEVHPNPNADDANNDGSEDAQEDEFVEIVNDTAAAIDLGGYELHDGSSLRHSFPAGTVLDAGCAIVVFGGGDFTEGPSVDFLGANLQKATSGSLGLNNNGDTVSLRNGAGIEVGGTVFGVVGNENGSLTMSPDLNLTNAFESHFVAGGTSSSAGRRVDGTEFCEFVQPVQLTLSVSPDTILEDAGVMASVLTITRAGDASAARTVSLSFDASEISMPATANFAVGESEITVDIDAVDDTAEDGDQPVVITASGGGFLDGTATITVQDDGDVSNVTLVINEVDYDEVGSDGGGEFIEIYDGGSGDTDLGGHVIVFYNGNGGNEYRTIDLAGKSTDENGFYFEITPSNGIQNGAPDGVALFMSADASLFDGINVDAILPAGTVMVDSLVYERGDDGTLDALGYTGPDLSDSNSDEGSLSRVPDGGDWQLALQTPGASNGSVTGSAYDTWAAGFPGIGGKLDDDDMDGLSNIAEYGLGKNPLTADRNANPMAVAVGGQLQLTATKGSEGGADSNLSYIVESSTDLASWATTDTSVITDDAGTITVAYTGTAPRAFLRLRMELE